MEHSEWYKIWFNTKYYHILYKDRDEKEADFFLSNILSKLKLKQNSVLWDTACGNGRHSYVLSQKGYRVIGTDICENNIMDAQCKYSDNKTQFFVHDMRNEFYVNYFDGALNIFTSLGYFKYNYEEVKAIKNMVVSVKNKGFVLIDFLNPHYVIQNIVPCETKIIDNIKFEVHRYIKDNCVIKKIEVLDNGQEYVFYEKVKLLEKKFFIDTLNKYGILEIELFGDYYLSKYNELSSKRMIFLGKKSSY